MQTTEEPKFMTPQTQNEKIQQFLDLYQQGKDNFIRAGEVLVELVEADPRVFQYITEKCPLLTPSVLQTFERIGRGQILPTLAMDNSPGGQRLKMCPLSVQRRFEAEPVPLLVSKPDGETDVMLVNYKDLTRTQAFQAIVDGHVATIDEQRARLAHVWQKNAKESTAKCPWVIRGRKVEFTQGVSLTAKQLAAILAQLTR